MSKVLFTRWCFRVVVIERFKVSPVMFQFLARVPLELCIRGEVEDASSSVVLIRNSSSQLVYLGYYLYQCPFYVEVNWFYSLQCAKYASDSLLSIKDQCFIHTVLSGFYKFLFSFSIHEVLPQNQAPIVGDRDFSNPQIKCWRTNHNTPNKAPVKSESNNKTGRSSSHSHPRWNCGIKKRSSSILNNIIQRKVVLWTLGHDTEDKGRK